MISIIITAYKEHRTIGKAIEAIINQEIKNYEVLVTAPDKETLDVARSYSKKNKSVKAIKDIGKGKSAALNFVVPKAKGDLLVLTDGDVHISEDALNNLLKPFANKKVGAVSGRPVSINSKKRILGYWSHLLTEIADTRRKKALMLRRRFFCSGYLFAIRKNLFPKLPENLLSEDGFISHKVYSSDHIIEYSDSAKVYVKYPTNFKDWIIQKKRSAGGYNQIRKMLNVEMRSFKKESLGFADFIKLAKTPKELFWIFELFLARIYLWIVIYIDVNFKSKTREEIWKRVESTK